MAKANTDSWGGSWTEKKLDAFIKYVQAYSTILKKQTQWKTIYFDGFAGSGDRGTTTDAAEELFKQLELDPKDDNVYKGAAERVLSIPDNLLFDFHYFVDRQESLTKLEAKLAQLPSASKTKLLFKPGDCNQWLGELTKALKKDDKYAALVLLDPFGMQINWSSIADLKGTRSDIWILVPTGVIINRLLYRNGKLEHIEKLESFFGLTVEEIKKEFYTVEKTPGLFGEEEITQKVMNPIRHIMTLYIRQLKTIWPNVTEHPLQLTHNGKILFHLVFASNNPTALKIAKQIITN